MGVMLYEVLTGKIPFEASSLLELGAMIRNGEVVPCREHDASISPGLEAVCLKALERDVAQRYPHANAFALDLGAALGTRGVSALRERVGTRWRRRLTVAALGLALALGAALAVSSAVGPHPLAATDLASTTSAFEAGRRSRAELEAALTATLADVGLQERRSAHLALARTPGTEAASWADRLAHARRVLQLDPSPEQRALAEAALGEAHAALGEHRQAALAFERALEGSSDLDLLARTAEALLAAGDSRAAERRASQLVERRLSRRGLELLFEAQLATQNRKGARATIKRLAPSPSTELLRARLAVACGQEPLTTLEAAVKSWPRDPRPVLELVRTQWLDINAPAAALHTAQRALDNGLRDPKVLALAATLRVLLSDAPDPLSVDPSLREDAARWFLREADREQAFMMRLRDNRYAVPERTLGAEERERRAGSALAAALQIAPPDSRVVGRIHLSLARLEGPDSLHLDPAQEAELTDPLLARLLASRLLARGDAAGALKVLGDDDSQESLLLQGEVLLALDRPADAVACLQEAAGAEREWAPACQALATALEARGWTKDAQVERERALLLESPRRKEAKAALDELRDRPTLRNSPREVIAEFLDRRVFVHDPLNVDATLVMGMRRLLARKPSAMREMGQAAWLHGTVPRRLASALFSVSSNSRSLVGRSRVLEALEAPFDPLRADPFELLFHALMTAWAVEYEDRNDLLNSGIWELSLCLRQDPGAGAARVMRAFLMLRAGQFEQAARDLKIAREHTPKCSSVSFYQTLLDAKRREPPAVILRGLRLTKDLRFKVWGESGWKPDLYPELRDYPRKSALDTFWRRVQ